jgi:hypothetical protein
MGAAIVITVRLLVPLLILRRRLAGALLSIVADAGDIVIFNIWGRPPWPYHQMDKILDLYYLGIEAWVAWRWAVIERRTAILLFGYRLIGVAVFEATGWRATLIVFPNLFELWFLFVLFRDRFRPHYRFTVARAVGWSLVLLVPKLFQEYALHVAQWLDQWVLSDVVHTWWRRLTGG